ncbi:hypothetical protein AALO_G00149190 [Alosa alosa]|uniref:Uncharacterized protein n=1 Tax=Alosa alosa TaxID=278164 RepID=A0AAV6GDU3_9TELE|nr:hypothetical protein AALO_G00149190 [Alosa alosa]
MTPGPLLVLLVGLPALAPPLGFGVHVTEVHLLHVLRDHNIVALRKEALQLREAVFRKPVLFWEFHLGEQQVFFTLDGTALPPPCDVSLPTQW